MLGKYAVVVAQLVSASGCGPEGRRFESGLPPHSRYDGGALTARPPFLCLKTSFRTKKHTPPRFAQGGLLPPARLLGLGSGCLALLDACASPLLRLGACAPCGPVRPRPFVRGIVLPPALRLGRKSNRPRFAWAERATARASLGRKEMLAFALLRLAGPIARAPLGLPPPQGPTSPTGRSCKKTLAAGRPEKELAILRRRCYIWTSGPVSFS